MRVEAIFDQCVLAEGASFDADGIEDTARRAFSQVMECAGFEHDWQVCIVFTDEEHIRDINRRMRGIDSATDVLSFPSLVYEGCYETGFVPPASSIDVQTGEVMLGDVVISLPRAREQAEQYGHSFAREVGYLCAHAAAHLLGYDHMNEQDKALMRALEEWAMSKIDLTR